MALDRNIWYATAKHSAPDRLATPPPTHSTCVELWADRSITMEGSPASRWANLVGSQNYESRFEEEKARIRVIRAAPAAAAIKSAFTGF